MRASSARSPAPLAPRRLAAVEAASLRGANGVLVAARGLRVGVARQLGDGRLAVAGLGEPRPERVAQVVPAQARGGMTLKGDRTGLNCHPACLTSEHFRPLICNPTLNRRPQARVNTATISR